ncbi:hypothetical protein D1007_37765 [Hordeum vulgare]|nr:hypothetical protein D1007_37765 [Hordeum vulgare]
MVAVCGGASLGARSTPSSSTSRAVRAHGGNQETSEHRRSRHGNLVINEGRRHRLPRPPSPPRGHLCLARPKKEPATPLVVLKHEHPDMPVDLDTGLKWSRDDYVREEMEHQRRALEEIVVRRRGREEGGVIVLDDNDEETPAQTARVRSGDPGQAAARTTRRTTTTTTPPSTSSSA